MDNSKPRQAKASMKAQAAFPREPSSMGKSVGVNTPMTDQAPSKRARGRPRKASLPAPSNGLAMEGGGIGVAPLAIPIRMEGSAILNISMLPSMIKSAIREVLREPEFMVIYHTIPMPSHPIPIPSHAIPISSTHHPIPPPQGGISAHKMQHTKCSGTMELTCHAPSRLHRWGTLPKTAHSTTRAHPYERVRSHSFTHLPYSFTSA